MASPDTPLSEPKPQEGPSKTPKYPNPPEVKPPKWANPPEAEIPDPTTLREQWRYAQRMYGRLYGQAWGTAIIAGVGLYAIGYWWKGSNPLLPSPSKKEEKRDS
eukprot:TRINITY_DN3146_c0_g2_i1.p2 TRINITY_DN3146_c0_g2~~TRINITY_DN3146_c0_g2_i1.p2  ORF type:complete len:104 (-),score=14.99 TRINITY_DN3146_c0_g2_i1:489-800(-)